MKYFILGSDTLSSVQRDAITNYLSGAGLGYWHWLPDFWLITSGDDRITGPSLRDVVKSIIPNVQFTIFPVEPVGTWAGVGDEKWVQWLNENWK